MIAPPRETETKNLALRCVKLYESNPSSYVQDVVKHALSSFYSYLLNAEFLAHIGYEKSSSGTKESMNRRNGFVKKKVRSSFGPLEVMVPRDRDGSFSPIAIRKHCRAVTNSESNVLCIYARGLSENDVNVCLQNMYGYEVVPERLRIITDKVKHDMVAIGERELAPIYAFVLVVRLEFAVNVPEAMAPDDYALYMVQGVTVSGRSEILDFFLCPPAPKTSCLTILERLRDRGVEDIVVLVAEGLAVKERDVQSVFPSTIVY